MIGVRPFDRGDTVRVIISDVSSFERRMGTRHRGWAPVLIGTGVGFAIGAIAGYSAGDDSKGHTFPLSGADKVLPGSSSLRLMPVDQRLDIAMDWWP